MFNNENIERNEGAPLYNEKRVIKILKNINLSTIKIKGKQRWYKKPEAEISKNPETSLRYKP
ncbi:hypothetical protein T190607A02C_110062 [Tenacibaculum sp. 190524A02b]